jgi:hypothetical protein
MANVLISVNPFNPALKVIRQSTPGEVHED